MLKILKITFAVFGGLLLLFASMQALATENSTGKSAQPATQIPPSPTPVAIAKVSSIDGRPLQDNLNIYKDDDPGSVITLYVTVRKGNVSDNSAYTWDEVNAFTKYASGRPIPGVVVGKADAIVQFGNGKGPVAGELGYGAVVPNATIQIRGQTTSLAKQKSYKIELLSSAGLWRGQSTLDLNKHPFDDTRIRNKLNFDLMKQIPNMTSLRTQFVHLYIKDETTIPWGKTFVDYGLFTQIEQPNRRFLKNHLLDPDGQLYKVTFFEFFKYPDKLRLTTDPLYDEKTFSRILEIKGSDDPTKLIQMLRDLNNYDIPIEQTFEKYFNKDNCFTWLAYNILVGNVDTQSQNFYIYSPQNANTWYFLPWDYDGAFPLRSSRASEGKFLYTPWESGISNYWGSVLFNRLFRVPSYRKDLDDKVTELKNFMTAERIKGMVDGYTKVVDPYVSKAPDFKNLRGTLKSRASEVKLLPDEIQENYDLYLESLKRPMPFFLNPPEVQSGALNFSWGESYDFGGEDITYHLEVSTDLKFNEIIAEGSIKISKYQVPMLQPGTYYWRVTATNQSGEAQIPFDSYRDPVSRVRYDGLGYLVVTPDGQVLDQ